MPQTNVAQRYRTIGHLLNAASASGHHNPRHMPAQAAQGSSDWKTTNSGVIAMALGGMYGCPEVRKVLVAQVKLNDAQLNHALIHHHDQVAPPECTAQPTSAMMQGDSSGPPLKWCMGRDEIVHVLAHNLAASGGEGEGGGGGGGRRIHQA